MYTFSPMMAANSQKHHCRVRPYTREVLVLSTNLKIQTKHYPLVFRNRRGDGARIKKTWYNQAECKKVIQALKDPRWIEAMQDELLQLKLQQVWTLVDLPYGKRAIGTKWMYMNKKDERSIVIRNNARLVAQGHTQEEGIDYDEVFAPVARIEAIRLFLAYASYKDFVVYQMDVKSAFLHGKIEEEVYVCQPPGLKDPDFPDRRRKIDKTLFIRRDQGDILIVQMNSMGELTFFLGLQVKQKNDGIFISQDKYVTEILKKFGFSDVKTASTPMETHKPLLKDADGEEVDVYLYRSMIGSLMYLTSSRPDIMFAVCACARYQVNPKVSHLHVVKRIFRYLKGQPKLGLWYPKDSPFDLVAYTDSDYAGASLDKKSTTGGCQFLRCRLISWQCKKQTVVANSTTEAEYVAASSCCGQVLWIQNQLLDYGDSNEKKLIQMIKIHTDKNVTDLLTKAFDVKTINGEVQLQALVDEKKIIITESTIRRDLQLEDAECIDCLPNDAIFEQLTLMGKPKKKDTQIPQSSVPSDNIAEKAINKENVPTHSNDLLLSGEDRLKLEELMALCTNLQNRVLDLEHTKTTQALEIDSFKRRAKKLEKKQRSKTHKLKRLHRGRKIHDIDADVDITLENVHNEDMFDTDVFNDKELFDKAMKRVNTFVDMDTELVGGSEQKLDEKVEAEVDDAKEAEELKKCLEVVPDDEDDVTIDATPLSVKILIVDYKIYQDGKKIFFKIIRADGKTQMYLTFTKMHKNFDREDLEVLWRIIKARFKKTELVNYMDTFLHINLKTMFEHHVKDSIWKNQQGLVKVLNWKLFDSCGVHYVTMQTIPYYLLVEKMYPLTKHTLHQMFNNVKLRVDYESKMAYELYRLVKKQLVLLVQKLLLLVLKVNAAGIKVTTAERIKTAQRKDKD
ncbi:putative ribonuclease H-like domain-containing protein [Tanacetum coccineum]